MEWWLLQAVKISVSKSTGQALQRQTGHFAGGGENFLRLQKEGWLEFLLICTHWLTWHWRAIVNYHFSQLLMTIHQNNLLLGNYLIQGEEISNRHWHHEGTLPQITSCFSSTFENHSYIFPIKSLDYLWNIAILSWTVVVVLFFPFQCAINLTVSN